MVRRATSLGLLLLAASFASLAVLAGCSGGQVDLRQTSGDGDDSASDGSLDRTPPPRGDAKGPPTEAECKALPPREGCHWTLMSTSYCDGPPPPPEMTWPHCSCEVCATDADCGAGETCATLAPEGECPDVVHLCVHPTRAACTPTSGCKPGEQCFAVDGAPACRVPVMYPPRP